MRKKGINVHNGQQNLAGGMDVCVVCCTVKDKGTSQDNQDKQVRKKYKGRTRTRWKEILEGARDFCFLFKRFRPSVGHIYSPVYWVPGG